MAQLKHNNYHKPKNIHGEGTVYYDRSHDLWVAQIPTVYKENGKKKKLTVYGKTPREARDKLEAAKLEKYFLLFFKPNNVTIGQLAKHIAESKLKLNEIQIQTTKHYRDKIERFGAISELTIVEATEDILKSYLQSICNYSQTTIRHQKEFLNIIFEQAVILKIIKENPMRNVSTPKSKVPTRKIRALTIFEQKRLTEILLKEKPLYWEQMLISLYLGLRQGEVNALTYNDINLDMNYINVDKTIALDENDRPFVNSKPKTDAGKRKVPICETIKPLLVKIKNRQTEENGDKQIFHTVYTRNYVRTTTVAGVFRDLLKKYDILDENLGKNYGVITQHSLRHTFCTRCVESGMDPTVLKVILGHTEIETTLQIYTSAFPDYKDESVALVDDYLRELNLDKN